MRLKSFFARNMTEAMRLVRETLGEDAIIVATREEDGGAGVRVTAAVEDDGVDPAFAFPPVGQSSGDLLETVTEAMLRHGAPSNVTDRLLAQLTGRSSGDPERALAGALDGVFRFAPLRPQRSPTPLVMVGPPGCGKTLTVARLASQAVLNGLRPAVLTTDNTRAGGDKQLAALMHILGVSLVVIEDAPSLSDALAAFASADLMLVDTAGRKPFDESDMRELRDLLSHAGTVEPVLVLSAGGDAHEAAEIGCAFADLGVRRLLPTQLDVSRRLGGLLAAAEAADLELCGASATWNPAEPLLQLDSVALATWLLEDARKQETRPPRRAATAR